MNYRKQMKSSSKTPKKKLILKVIVTSVYLVIFILIIGFRQKGTYTIINTTTDQGLRPFAEYQDTGYVLLPALDGHDTKELKRTVVRHLPSNVTLILYGPTASEVDQLAILSDYGRFISEDRIVYFPLSKSNEGFWARDGFPMPSLDEQGQLVLTDAKYWHNFEPDALVGGLFGAKVLRHNYQFEGGNLMANHLGDCFVVNTKETKKIPDTVFGSHYGCRTLGRLLPRGGIGHIDERARFVNASTVLTDTSEYEAMFVSHNFKTVMLPRPMGLHETYVNSLIVNGTAFVPQFGRPNDEVALEVYRSLGFTVVGLDSKHLTKKARGLIHCLTMNYPRVPLAELSKL